MTEQEIKDLLIVKIKEFQITDETFLDWDIPELIEQLIKLIDKIDINELDLVKDWIEGEYINMPEATAHNLHIIVSKINEIIESLNKKIELNTLKE